MKLTINHAALLDDWLGACAEFGEALSIGRLTVDFTTDELARIRLKSFAPTTLAPPKFLTAESYFLQSGYSNVLSLDSAQGGGADILLDIGVDEIPEELRGRFSLVINAAGLQGARDILKALQSTHAMVAPGGAALHFLPCNNLVNIGYYQISPKLMFELCSEAGYKILRSALISYNPRRHGGLHWEVHPFAPTDANAAAPGLFDDRVVVHALLARRPRVTLDAFDGGSLRGPRWFSPFRVSFGVRIDRPNRHVVPLRSFVPGQGLAWQAHVPELANWCDTLTEQRRSPLILLEDGVAIGGSHAAHNEVSAAGGGTFSHWGEYLIMSTTDGSDPNTNGRTYFAVLPYLDDIWP